MHLQRGQQKPSLFLLLYVNHLLKFVYRTISLIETLVYKIPLR